MNGWLAGSVLAMAASQPEPSTAEDLIARQREMVRAALRDGNCKTDSSPAPDEILVCARDEISDLQRLGPTVSTEGRGPTVLQERRALLDIDRCDATRNRIPVECQAGIPLIPIVQAILEKLRGD